MTCLNIIFCLVFLGLVITRLRFLVLCSSGFQALWFIHLSKSILNVISYDFFIKSNQFKKYDKHKLGLSTEALIV